MAVSLPLMARNHTLWFDTDEALVAIQVETRRVREVGATYDTTVMGTVWTWEEPFTAVAQKIYLAWVVSEYQPDKKRQG